VLLSVLTGIVRVQLAPGGHMGRFCVWTKSAFEALDTIFGACPARLPAPLDGDFRPAVPACPDEDHYPVEAPMSMPPAAAAAPVPRNLRHCVVCSLLNNLCHSRSRLASRATGTQDTESTVKKGFKVPRVPMANTDLSRVINSDEIQSVVNAPKTPKMGKALKKNPLKNLGAMLKLNPYAKTLRRRELAQQARPWTLLPFSVCLRRMWSLLCCCDLAQPAC
jgi:60S ribosomal protein L4 C-terminal domain